ITSANHGLTTGAQVVITGVGGNTTANATWTITRIDANTFSLNGSTGNAAYTSGGTWKLTTTPLNTPAGSNDVFVTKINPAGTAIVWSAIFGGSGDDRAFGIALDKVTGEAYLTGATSSTNFPLMKSGVAGQAIQSTFGGGSWDGFVTKLNASGTGIVFSTYLGGSGNDNNAGILGWNNASIALDSAGNAWVTGMTESTNFPVTAGALQATHAADGGNRDAF